MEVERATRTSPALRRYIDLFTRFVDGNITAAQFEDSYTEWVLADPVMWEQSVSNVINRVFADADAYVESDELRPQVIDAIDADELRESVAKALAELQVG